jgi:hypothetical protein
MFVAALDIETRDVPTVSSINSLLSQYCKASLCVCQFLCIGGATVRLAPVVPWAKDGPVPGLHPPATDAIHFKAVDGLSTG